MIPYRPAGREKAVFVRSYRRFRHGQWEHIRSHFRSWPR